MKADKISVADLFDRQRRYAVPEYQRPYVWTQDDQWAPLWDDIVEKARLVATGKARAPHFLGAIVTSQRPVYGEQISAWDIIDGQQRLTTLQLVLAAFRNVVKASGEQRFDHDLERLTRNTGLMAGPDERFKVWPTNADRATFRAVMEASSAAKVVQAFPSLRLGGKHSGFRLAEAYIYFHQQIERYVVGAPGEPTSNDAGQRVQAMFETFRRYLQIVNIELEAEDDPQVIFESLNGRGVPLLPSDLVRNYVFLKAEAGKSLDDLYDNYWRPYDEADLLRSGLGRTWWKDDERQGRLRRPRLDLFLFHYLQYRLGHEVNIGHLFQEFRNWWDDTAVGRTDVALAEMLENAKPFASWMSPSGSGREARFASFLQAQDTSTVYPLLFQILVGQADGMPAAERDGILDDLESYLFRRAVCGLTISGHPLLLGLLEKLQAEPALTRTVFRKHLMAGDGPSVRWPGDEEFGRAFIHRPAYKDLKRQVLNQALRALEEAHVTTKHEQIAFLTDLSIEHVMPQSWERHWKLQDRSDEALEKRERLLHSFGNLTLVTKEFNSALSDRGFDIKQAELKRIGRLLLNKAFDKPGTWDEKSIVKRGRELFEVARRRWPHPLSPESLDTLILEPHAVASWSQTERPDQEPNLPTIDPAAARNLLRRFAALRTSTTASQEN